MVFLNSTHHILHNAIQKHGFNKENGLRTLPRFPTTRPPNSCLHVYNLTEIELPRTNSSRKMTKRRSNQQSFFGTHRICNYLLLKHLHLPRFELRTFGSLVRSIPNVSSSLRRIEILSYTEKRGIAFFNGSDCHREI